MGKRRLPCSSPGNAPCLVTHKVTTSNACVISNDCPTLANIVGSSKATSISYCGNGFSSNRRFAMNAMKCFVSAKNDCKSCNPTTKFASKSRPIKPFGVIGGSTTNTPTGTTTLAGIGAMVQCRGLSSVPRVGLSSFRVNVGMGTTGLRWRPLRC